MEEGGKCLSSGITTYDAAYLQRSVLSSLTPLPLLPTKWKKVICHRKEWEKQPNIHKRESARSIHAWNPHDLCPLLPSYMCQDTPSLCFSWFKLDNSASCHQQRLNAKDTNDSFFRPANYTYIDAYQRLVKRIEPGCAKCFKTFV